MVAPITVASRGLGRALGLAFARERVSLALCCLGEPSAKLRALLAGSPVQLFTPFVSL